MLRYLGRGVGWFVSVVMVVTPAMAQTHVVDQAAIDAALRAHVSEDDVRREAVLRVLERSEVRELAAKIQVDLTQAEDAVQTLEGEELIQLASMAHDVEAGLSGGDTITLSTTTIIIGLLLLILIIVAT